MPEDQNQAVLQLLNSISKDLAVNTTKTSYIEEHLRTLNGKVVKQEEKQQRADKERGELITTVGDLVSSKRRWNDGWLGVLKQVGLFALGLLSAYIILHYISIKPHVNATTKMDSSSRFPMALR